MMPEPTTVATRIAVPSASASRRRRERHAAESLVFPMALSCVCSVSLSSERSGRLTKIEMRFDEHAEGIREGEPHLAPRCRSRRPDRNAPMRGHRLARPERAGLAGRVVADREDEIERRRAGAANSFQLFERKPLTSKFSLRSRSSA